MNRVETIDEFYKLLTKLEQKIGGKKFLAVCNGRMNWPKRGVYFFFENGEIRKNGDMRVVRIGTHALKQGSKTSLWHRLNQHRGNIGGSNPGGGNHRGSIFRLHVGSAIIRKYKLESKTWGKGSSAERKIRDSEYQIEKLVSKYIDQMPFLWIGINDQTGPDSDRRYIEKNSIALLSNFIKIENIDPPSSDWLGKYAKSEKITNSGLWNVNHINEEFDINFLILLERYIEEV